MPQYTVITQLTVPTSCSRGSRALTEERKIDLPVSKSVQDIAPLESIHLCDLLPFRALIFQSMHNPSSFFRRKELSRVREIVNGEEGDAGHNDGEDPF